jgi:hypothetical protein
MKGIYIYGRRGAFLQADSYKHIRASSLLFTFQQKDAKKKDSTTLCVRNVRLVLRIINFKFELWKLIVEN